MIEPAALFALCAALLLALRDIFGRIGLRGVDPILGTGASALLGLPVLALVSALAGDFQHPWPGLGRPLLLIAVSGTLRITAARTLLFAATQYVGSARAGTLAATSTFFAIFLGVSFLGERLTLPLGAGAALVVCGYVLLVQRRAGPKGAEPPAGHLLGIGLALLSALAFGASSALVRPAVGGFASPNQANLYANAFAVAAYLPFVWWRMRRGEGVSGWSGRTWGVLALAGSVAALGVTFLYLALARAPVVFAVPIVQSRPLFVVAISWAFFQTEERVTWRVAAGAAVIVAGTALLIGGR
ncbi:MAG: EamA family transporter [bacterium]